MNTGSSPDAPDSVDSGCVIRTSSSVSSSSTGCVFPSPSKVTVSLVNFHLSNVYPSSSLHESETVLPIAYGRPFCSFSSFLSLYSIVVLPALKVCTPFSGFTNFILTGAQTTGVTVIPVSVYLFIVRVKTPGFAGSVSVVNASSFFEVSFHSSKVYSSFRVQLIVTDFPTPYGFVTSSSEETNNITFT